MGSNRLNANEIELLDKLLSDAVMREYELFFQLMQLNSKAAIYSRSREIESKKAIVKALCQEIPYLSVEQKQELGACENILDSAYRFLIDSQEAGVAGNVKKFLKQYKGS